MSSSEPLRTRALAADLAEHGIQLVDAPVSGGVKRRAERHADDHGRRAPMPTWPRSSRCWQRSASRTCRPGRWAGHALKALNNLMSATHLLVTSEAMLAGEHSDSTPR